MPSDTNWRYYRVMYKTGHLGTNEYEAQTVIVRSERTAVDMWELDYGTLGAAKHRGILNVAEVSRAEWIEAFNRRKAVCDRPRKPARED